MVDTREQIEQRLSVLIGLDMSGAGCAADMLTLQFGPIREMTTKRGTIKHVGAWALHIQCGWKIERANEVFVDASDFAVSDESTRATLERVRSLITSHGPFIVERVAVGDNGNMSISMSGQLRLLIVTDAAPDEEDWRFFEPGSEGKHFVIQGGKVDPWSLA
ncbi:hypothetical protein B0G62_10191 [Paraburkholderia eburnea]|uniref:Uncharacterized protein n=1 Tax=Paraburkholderia eburnea TaxID=1189126 RepID=A0A2S4MMW6_9BURK|nr:hypothetical protein [Paraburkholderia eburnea]POR55697.1 hypothetical protein B0G62_10191 [Paraburkholderia eburnea]PRZ26825.1 hypothetical protein BX588_10191 [Paraburkholderia eburnea]